MSGDAGSRRIAWVVINVRDAERSRDFYERFTTLRGAGRIEGHGPAFGVEHGAFVGHAMRDPSSDRLPTVLLMQWKDPAPVGETYPSHTNPGFFRMCFQTSGAGALYEEVVAAGYEPLSPLRLPKPGRSTGRPVFCVRDPDGTVLQFLTFGEQPRLYHVNCNTNDLARADAFFGQALGLHYASHSTSTTPEEHGFGPGGDLHTYDARLYAATGEVAGAAPSLILDVVESTFPPPVGQPYASPVNVGIARVGVEVADVAGVFGAMAAEDAAYAWRSPQVWDIGLERRLAATLRSPDGVAVDLVSAPRGN